MLHTPHALEAVRRRLRATVRAAIPSVALLTALGTAAQAQTYYVDASANCATATGTQANPYCTINAAMTAHKGPGITIIVNPGTYREQVTVNASGAAGSLFVFQAAAPGVLVDGSDDFSAAALWATTGTANEFVAASVTWAPKQVFVDGARLAATTNAPGTMPSNSWIYVAGQGLYVDLGGSSPSSHATLVGHRLYGFNLSTKSFVKIDGFQVAHTEDRGINMQNPCNDLTISHNNVSFAASYGIQTVNGQRITIDGNTVSDNAFHGIGLTAGASGCVVSNNECFRNAHPTIRQANGIYLFGAPGNTVTGNRLHDNQDTGLQFNNGSDNCVSQNNRSYNNGDHGYDHLLSTNVQHRNDEAYHNYLDGFSFEGTAPSGQVHNCIATDNGEYDLWVDQASSVGFVSDYNLFWNSTTGTAPSGVPQMPVKFIATPYATVAAFSAANGGLDAHSKQSDPKFTNAGAADFRLLGGSPAIDAGNSGVTNWPATDALGGARIDDPATANTGAGPMTFSDIGALEYAPPLVDHAPVVVAPANVKGVKGVLVTFNVTASDSDGDAISSLTMVLAKMPVNSGATFVPNATNTGGTFSWTPAVTGKFQVKFVATNAKTGSATSNIQIAAPKKHDGTGDDTPADVPVIAMSQPSPNPTWGAVSFTLDLPEASDVDLSVYDMQGRRVYQESRSLSAGHNSMSWSGLSTNRQRLGTGMYFVRAQVGSTVLMRRVIRF